VRVGLLVLMFVLAAVRASAQAPVPSWWNGVVVTNDSANPTDNWAMTNLGQLKNMATAAKAHLDNQLNLTGADWANAYSPEANPFPFAIGANPENYEAIKIGQLKFIASGFYRILRTKAPSYGVTNRLQSLGLSAADYSTLSDGTLVPWSSTTGPGENHAAATIGQLKIAFSFDLGAGSGGPQAPVITTHPASANKVPGESATFNVAATGAPTLAYQWRKDGSNLANGGNISGAASATLTVTNVQNAIESRYTVVVTNGAGSVTSNPAVLNVGADTDGDGMADNWEAHYFGTTARNGTSDYDGDEILDKDEFTFGLNPISNDTASPSKRMNFAYTANDELSLYTPVVGSPTSYSPDPEGNLKP